jgi:ankyrin repeat protein
VKATDPKGHTPLAVALERKNPEVVELLRKAGAKEYSGTAGTKQSPSTFSPRGLL